MAGEAAGAGPGHPSLSSNVLDTPRTMPQGQDSPDQNSRGQDSRGQYSPGQDLQRLDPQRLDPQRLDPPGQGAFDSPGAPQGTRAHLDPGQPIRIDRVDPEHPIGDRAVRPPRRGGPDLGRRHSRHRRPRGRVEAAGPRPGAELLGLLVLGLMVLGAKPAMAAGREARVQGAASDPGAGGRTFVLAVDGVDTGAVRAAIEGGRLPHIAALVEGDLPDPWVPENIHDAAEAWARIASGARVERHGVQGATQLAVQAGRPRQSSGPFQHDLERSLHELAGAPLPRVSPRVYGVVAGLLASLAFWVLFSALLRMRARTSFLMSSALGLSAAVGGWRLRTYLPERVPVSESRLAAEAFWERAAREGVQTATLFVPGSLPFGPGRTSGDDIDIDLHTLVPGRGLPGLDRYPEGVSLSPTGPRRVELRWPVDDDGVQHEVRRELIGPLNFWRQVRDRRALEDAQRVRLPWLIERRDGRILALIGGAKAELDPRTWSPWMPLTFDLNPVLKIRGMTRLWLESSSEEGVVLWLDGLQLDPWSMPFWKPWVQRGPLASDPERFPRLDLLAEVKEDPRLPLDAVLEAAESDWRARWSWVEGTLEGGEFGLVTAVLDTPRRLHSALAARAHGGGAVDPRTASSILDGPSLGAEPSDALDRSFLADLDGRLGVLRSNPKLGIDRWILIFLPTEVSTPRVFDPNAWLASTGRLAVRDGDAKGSSPEASEALPRPLDPTGTEAFVVGPGLVYLNRERSSGFGERLTRAENLRRALRPLLAEGGPGEGTGGPLAEVNIVARAESMPSEPDLVLHLAPGWSFARSDFRSSVAKSESPGDGSSSGPAHTLEAWPRGSEVLVLCTPAEKESPIPGRLEDLADWILDRVPDGR